MQRFGIFSPVMGIKQDFPAELLENTFTPDAENVRVVDGEIHLAKMRRQILIDGDYAVDIIHLHRLDKVNGNSYLFAFTAQGIYLWEPVGGTWDDYLTEGVSLTATTEWSTITFNEKVIATNNKDKVLVGDNSTTFTWLDTASGVEYATTTYLTRARFVAVYENYLLLGDTTEDGTVHSRRVRWSDIGDEANWFGGDGGYVDFSGSDRVTGVGHSATQLIILKERSVHRMFLTAGDLVFNTAEITMEYGCTAPKSVINAGDGSLIFLASDKRLVTVDGQEISAKVAPILRQIPDDYINLVYGHRVREYDELWWSIPYGIVTANNKILSVSKTGDWQVRDMSVVCFERFDLNTTYTIDNVPYDSIDEWNWESIDSIEGSSGYLLDVGASGSAVYSLHDSTKDAGSEFTGFFVMATDLAGGKDLLTYKRLLQMTFYFRAEGHDGDITVSIQKDRSGSYQSVGTVTPAGSGNLRIVQVPCDVRARHFLIKISATQRFRFLGVIFDYIPNGIN